MSQERQPSINRLADIIMERRQGIADGRRQMAKAQPWPLLWNAFGILYPPSLLKIGAGCSEDAEDARAPLSERRNVFGFVLLFVFASCLSALGEDFDFFEKKIRPVLV